MNDDDVHHALPPRCMQSDDPSEAEGARRRVRSPNNRFSWAHFHRRRDSSASSRQEIAVTAPASASASATGLVDLPDSSGLSEDEGKDIYRWAILYEVCLLLHSVFESSADGIGRISEGTLLFYIITK
jgi:hypothetical protein